MHVLLAHLAARADAGGPVDDQRVGHAALVRLALPAPERRVARHRPAPRVVVVDARPADLVEPLGRLLHRARQRVPHAGVVERAHRHRPRTRRRCPTARSRACCRARRARRSRSNSRPSSWSVCERYAGEGLHVAGEHARARSSERSAHAGTQSGRGDSSVCSGSSPAAFWRASVGVAPRVPALVEVAAVALDPLGRRLVRRVARAGGHVEEPRLVDVDVAEVLDPLDGVVHQVAGEVVAVLARSRAARRGGCRGSARGRTGASHRGRTRTSARSRARAASGRGDAPRCSSSSGREVPLADRVGGVAVRA